MYYFASDIHLGAGDAATARAVERRFVAWLDDAARDAEAIFLVGDIFDFWFEYRRVVPKGFVRTLGKLAELTDRGVRVVFFTGNHDMWVGDYLARECGLEIHTSPEVMTLSGKKVFIAHGDCRQDAETLAKLIQEKNPPKKIIITPFDPTNGAHAGPGSLAIFFEGDEHARQH